MNCDEARSRLHELVDGELDPPGEAALREHFAGCVTCRQSHEDFDTLRKLVRAKFEKPVPRTAFQCACLARAYAGEHRSRTRWVRAVAAVLLLGAILASVHFLIRSHSPLLGHAEASSACADAFRHAFAGRPLRNDLREGWEGSLAAEIRSATGLSIEHLPEIQNARYAGWQVETIKGVKGARIDFYPLRSGEAGPREDGMGETAEPVVCRRDLISLFYFPLSSMRFSEDYLRKLEAGHRCTRCIAMKDGSILCYRSSGLLISVVSNLGEGELVARHFPR